MVADDNIKAEGPFNHLEPTCQYSLESEYHETDQGKALADIVRNLLTGGGINKCDDQKRTENKTNINNDVYKTSPHDHYLLCLHSMQFTANKLNSPLTSNHLRHIKENNNPGEGQLESDAHHVSHKNSPAGF